MKFKCNQQTLAKCLNTVSKAITTRTTIPVLKGILLTATEDNKLTMTASDMDMSIEKIIDANVEESGSTVVAAKLFGDIIRKLPNEEIIIKLNEDGSVNIKTLSSEFNIIGMTADEFPNIGDIKDVKAQLSFNKDMLKDMIRKTHFCASIDESKGIIVGVLMELEKDSFNMAALDGFRMAVAREKMSSEKEENIIISAKKLNEISKILSETESDEDVNFIVSDKKAVMLLEKTKVVVRLLEGEFIKYKDILPKEKNTTMVIDKNELLASIERASLLAKEGKNNLIKFELEENLLSISSTSEEGKVKEEIMMDKEGEDLEIGFNSKYVMDALKVIEDENIVMEFNTSTTPCILKPLEGNSYEYLILPVRIPSV
ncbi:MAG: DNA polymerase III subunit beta [Eubacteriaceae bacterium]|nr:DNA polymerase III subunit beta [Eubacteriaceae bacterium]